MLVAQLKDLPLTPEFEINFLIEIEGEGWIEITVVEVIAEKYLENGVVGTVVDEKGVVGIATEVDETVEEGEEEVKNVVEVVEESEDKMKNVKYSTS